MPRPTPLNNWDPASVGRWRLLARLGVGGQATVYLGVDQSGVEAAVKVLHIDRGSSASLQRGLKREWASVTRLVPFLTAKVLDFDPGGPLPFIASEYIAGPTLAESVRENGPLKASPLHQIAMQTMTALEAIHEARLIHCDVKPANIILGDHGARVIDFGIARNLDSTHRCGEVSGTIPFMAPEQILDLHLSPMVDIFAWGSTMVFAGTGRRAFPDQDPTTLLRQIINDPPQLYDLDPSMRDIVRRCLHKDPHRRPTAAQARRMLLGFTARGDAGTRPLRRVPRATVKAGASTLFGSAVPGPAPDSGRPPNTGAIQRRVPRHAVPRRTVAASRPMDRWLLRTWLVVINAAAMVVWIVGFMTAG